MYNRLARASKISKGLKKEAEKLDRASLILEIRGYSAHFFSIHLVFIFLIVMIYSSLNLLYCKLNKMNKKQTNKQTKNKQTKTQDQKEKGKIKQKNEKRAL